MEEKWRVIGGYEGFYEVSNLGRVKSLQRKIIRKNGRQQTFQERILAPAISTHNYPTVSLKKSGFSETYLVHRLVANAFIANPDNKPEVNHKDGDRGNSKYTNLEWVTRKENMIDAVRRLGKTFAKSRKKPVKGISEVKELVFDSATDAARWLGMNRCVVMNAIRQDCCAGGFKWEYLSKEEYDRI